MINKETETERETESGRDRDKKMVLDADRGIQTVRQTETE